MQQQITKLFLILLLSTKLYSQDKEIDRLVDNELKMNFPSIYFKHNSTDYAVMPYTADSCFKYIASHIKDINDLVIWRDSLETEKLTKQRIKKLTTELSKRKVTGIYIQSMGKEQKISQRTILKGVDSVQTQYLLSLNSVFEIAKTRLRNKISASTHGLWLFGTCWKCILTEPFISPGYFTNKRKREHCRMDRKLEQKSAKKK